MSIAFTSRLARLTPLSDADHKVLSDLIRDTHHFSVREIVPFARMPKHKRLVILDGWAAQQEAWSGRDSQTTVILLPGDIAREPVNGRHDRYSNVFALTEVLASFVDLNRLRDAALRSPAISDALQIAVRQEEMIARAWIINLGRRSAEGRIASVFCELHIRAEKLGVPSIIPVTQSQIASITGLTSVHVNRMLKLLREAGLINVKTAHIEVLDLHALVRRCAFVDTYLK